MKRPVIDSGPPAMSRVASTVLSEVTRDGLVLPAKTRFSGEVIRACHLKNADLSAPIFDDCMLEDCTFEKCDFGNVRFFHGSVLKNCRFKHVDLRAGGLTDSVFSDCIFTRCDFRGTFLGACSFTHCTFDNCKIIDNSFDAANTRHCTFSGKLHEVNFVAKQPGTALRADFEGCILDFVAFGNCSLEHIVPPRDARHLYFKDLSARASKALAHVLAQPECATTKVLKRRLEHYATQRGGILNLKNLEEIEGKAFAEQLMQLLGSPT